jgi:hypothetical protein
MVAFAHRLPVRIRRGLMIVPLAFALASSASAGTEQPAALLVFPHIQVSGGGSIDTLILIANTADGPTNVECFYANAIGHCTVSAQLCTSGVDCGPVGTCDQGWAITDFLVPLTPKQVLGWEASAGLSSLPIGSGAIPPVPTDPFIGELRCVEVDANAHPVARNDLIGSATLSTGPPDDEASYSAVGIRSTGVNDGDATLCLGDSTSGPCALAEYAACPDTLSLNIFFDNAVIGGQTAENELTLIPCSAFYVPRPGKPTPDAVSVNVTFVVDNEFEVQTKTTIPIVVKCFDSFKLSSLVPSGIFDVATQGTLSGQVTIMTQPIDPDAGQGILGVALQRMTTGSEVRSSAHGLNSIARVGRADVIGLPPAP